MHAQAGNSGSELLTGVTGRLTPFRRRVRQRQSVVRTLLQDHPQAQIMLTEGGMLQNEKQAALRSYIADTVRVVGDPRVHAIASTGYPGDSEDGHPTKEQSISIANDLLPQVRAVMHW